MIRLLHRSALAALVAVALASCIATIPQDVQAFRLFFELDENLAAGEQVEAHSTVFPREIVVRGNFVRVFGRITPPAGSPLPDRVELDVVHTELATQQVYYRFRPTVTVDPDGSFVKTKRFARNIAGDTLQTVLVRPVGAALPPGTEVAVCVEMSKRKSDLSAGTSCAPGGGPSGGNVATVRVLDNAFDPRSVLIEPGDTVRWVLEGAATNHTVTEMSGVWNSGFSLQVVGATFERTFPEGEDGLTFQYFCVTHQSCCAMQGSVQVGAAAPPPPPGY